MTDDEKKKMIDDITNGVYKHMQNALGIKDSDHE